MIRPIAIGLSPNLESDDILLAIKNVLSGKTLIASGKTLDKLKLWFNNNLQFKSIFLFNSARSALFIALKAIGIGKGDEVLVPAFTCVAVPNAVIWTGAKPVFIDINKEDLGIDITDLKSKINNKTKVIIIQHTFGIPAKIEAAAELAQKHNLVVVEDCAHCLKTKQNNRYLGSYGDMSVFSFGRDKTVSSVFGGVLSVNNKKYLKKIEKIYHQLSFPSRIWTFKQHLHIILMSLVLPLYNLTIGKIILFLSQKTGLLTPPVYPLEKAGLQPSDFPKKLPNALALLALNQLKKLDRFNGIRRIYTKEYQKIFPENIIKTNDFPLLRYPLPVEKRDELVRLAKNKKIILGNWYSNVVDPKGVNFQKINYRKCPTAENVAQHIINLPTYPTLSEKDFRKVLSFIKEQNQYFQ